MIERVWGIGLGLHAGSGRTRRGERCMTDDQFVADFEAGLLRNENFHHREHVRMGFVYMSRFPVLEALRRACEGLQRLAATTGRPNLYHETITWAFLLLIRERLARALQHSGSLPSWDEFAADNQDLLRGKDQVLKEYYRDETLNSELARKTFILPDRSLALSEKLGHKNEAGDFCGKSTTASPTRGRRFCTEHSEVRQG